MYRHGDVLLVPVTSIPANAGREERDGDLIIALGEATGHAHRIEDPAAERWLALPAMEAWPNGNRDGEQEGYLVLPVEAEIKHEEHRTLLLPAGIYRIVRQREYSPAGSHGPVGD